MDRREFLIGCGVAVVTVPLSMVLNGSSVREVKQMLDITANDYWHYHFRFGETTAYQPKTVGSGMINNVVMNTVVPLLFAYGKYHHESSFQSKALQWLEKLPAESNAIVTRFRSFGVLAKNASDTQSLIELKTQYCDKKRCLDCAIANALLKKI